MILPIVVQQQVENTMVQTPQGLSPSPTQNLVKQALQCGQITRQDHLRLTSAILADVAASPTERNQVNRVLDYIRTGRVKLID